MSKLIGESEGSWVELTNREDSLPETPNWLGEALLLGKYWLESGVLAQLQEQVRVKRGRMGDYEVCDFVLLLLTYGISGEKTLADFFESLKPVQSLLMAVWGRKKSPSRSALSRFLVAIDNDALEKLRGLFEKDLEEKGFQGAEKGGLIDRRGERYWMFDLDGTKQAARQRSLPSSEKYPATRRRSQPACAKGYGGRKRGEVMRTRSTMAQAHTSEWLGTFGASGNGTPGPDLQRACEVLQKYVQRHGLAGNQAIMRLDGYYGLPKFVNTIQEHQLGYLLRSRDYGLLEHQSLQARLKVTPVEFWTHPESHQVREVFDLGLIEDNWAGYLQPIRLIVVRTPHDPKHSHRVGKKRGDFIYELFITSLTSPGLSGSDVLSLYYGRGGFEKLLADEDAEQNSDRWCSWHPQGQEFWQILNQWVWNWRLWAGLAYQPILPRQTLWSPVSPESLSLTDSQTLTDEPLKLTENPKQPKLVNHSEDEYGEMQVTGGWARSRNKFSGDDFTLLDERTLKCPASHLMYRREVRQNRYGDLLILFGINPRTCQQCSLKSQCLADGSKGTGGRRITVIRKKKGDTTAPESGPESKLTLNSAPISSHLTPPLRKIDDPNRPVLWLDFPTTQLRRNLTHQLRHQQIIFESTNCTTSANPMPVSLMTRDQRAHRRLSWSQRWERNSLKETETHWQVTLFGLSSTILNWLEGLKSIADVTT